MDPTPAPRRAALIVPTVGWLITAGCWIGSLFVPWTSSGALSSATLLEAARLVRRGSVDSVVPPAVSFVLIVPGVVGVALIALVGFRGRGPAALRMVLVASGTVLCVVLAWRLTGGDLGRAGSGTWLAAVGIVAGAVASVLTLAAGRGRADRRTPTPATD